MSTTIEQLDIQIQASSTSAVSGIEALAESLGKLRGATKGGLGLTSVVNQLKGLSGAIDGLKSADVGSVGAIAESLKTSLEPLSTLSKSNLNSFITPLKNLPKVMEGLNGLDMGALKSKILEVADALDPLATKMEAISKGFSAFPAKLQKLIAGTNKLSGANKNASLSYVNFVAKISTAVVAVKKLASIMAGWITKSNEYVEDMNLFTVSMGEFTDEAKDYANTVSELMGIDPAEWMRDQGIFMTLANGFGVASDRAYIMSKNLTQLTYDLSSFFNIGTEEAFQKLQSGLAGELEPLRRLGYDLSVARLQQEAYALGIEKKVSAMTQAEKAELRYYAIMTQVTSAQGDMARTLEAPSNQIRIFKAQVEQCARALGNIFIPVLNKVLPYAIAFTKVIRVVAEMIAQLVGFALPEIDYSNVNNISSSLEDANDEAKKLKNSMLGIDELNVLSQDDSSSDSSLGGLDFELPEYDFLTEAVNGKVDEIVKKMKEWLGITGEINTWSEFFDTKLGHILETIGLIAAGILAWKLTKGFIDSITMLKTLLATPSYAIAISAAVTVAGGATLASGINDAVEEGVNESNAAKIVGGGLLTTAGAAVLGSKIATWITKSFADSAVAKALTSVATGLGASATGVAGAAIMASVAGIVVGLPTLFVGIWDACKNGIDWLSALLIPAGATAGAAGIGAIIGMLGGPIGAGIGALIGLAVGLVTDGIILIVQKWDAIVAFFKTFFTVTIPTMWENFKTWVVATFTTVVGLVSGVVDAVVGWFEKLPGRIGYALGYAVGATVEWAIDAWDYLKVKVPEIVEAVVTFFKELPGKLWNVIVKAFDKIKEWCTEAIKVIKREVPKIINKFVEFFKKIPSLLKELGVDIWNGLINGMKTAWNTVKDAASDLVTGFVNGFKDALGIHSPSRVFYEMAGYTIEGFNNGIYSFGKSTKGVVSDWSDSFANTTPTMGFAVDTSALKYYNSDSFSKAVSANVATNTSVTATGFMEGMEEFYREYVAPTMSQMASDMRRQADKNEQTVVQIGNRTVSNAVSTQRRANGYAFAR